jgi:hypothetical protein
MCRQFLRLPVQKVSIATGVINTFRIAVIKVKGYFIPVKRV